LDLDVVEADIKKDAAKKDQAVVEVTSNDFKPAPV
jgi:hypothetical protein